MSHNARKPVSEDSDQADTNVPAVSEKKLEAVNFGFITQSV